MSTRRLGILGGTFDPIHCGHLDLGQAAQSALGLTEVVVITAHIPPHRTQPRASSYHRFAMVALAIAGRECWRASDLELTVGSTSFTTGTLQRFHDSGFPPAELFFIIGADAFAEIESWKDFPAILDRAHFAVVSRPGLSVGEMRARLPALALRMAAPPEVAARQTPSIFLIDAPTWRGPDVPGARGRQVAWPRLKSAGKRFVSLNRSPRRFARRRTRRRPTSSSSICVRPPGSPTSS
jgi:nicotinate-nucleotide adenylyltransferase